MAQSVDKRIPKTKKNETRRRVILGNFLVIASVGLFYNVWSFAFKATITSALISLYFILQLIIPILYLIFVSLFGVAFGVTTYYEVFAFMGVETPQRLWLQDVINALPALFFVVCLLTVYLAFVYYFARQYYKSIWVNVRNNRSA